jgi:hypothetical protein
LRRPSKIRITEGPRFAALEVGDALAQGAIGSLSGVKVVGTQVFCRWLVGPGRYLVTTSSQGRSTAAVVSSHADGEEILLMGIKGDSVGPQTPSGRIIPANQRKARTTTRPGQRAERIQ